MRILVGDYVAILRRSTSIPNLVVLLIILAELYKHTKHPFFNILNEYSVCLKEILH